MTDRDHQLDLNELLLINARKGCAFYKAEEIEETRRRVKDLIAQGANVNYNPEDGSSALDSAVSGGDPEVVQLLLDLGAKVTNGTVMRACNRAGVAADNLMYAESFIKADAATREQIALMIIAKAAKEDFIGTNWQEKTVLDFAAPSATVTAALKDALKGKGLTEADLSSPKQKVKKFINIKLRGFKP